MTRKLPCDPALDNASDEGANGTVHEVTLTEERATGARVINSPQWQGAKIVSAYVEPLVDAGGDQYTPTIDELARDLKASFAQVNAGSLAEVESMLLGQAKALEAIFAWLASQVTTAPSLHYTEKYLALAFKAQAQSRATLTALAEVKHPRHPNFIGQQNVAVNQQINNPAAERLDVEGGNRQIELLETSNGERMDDGTQSTTGGADQAMAPVGAIDGTNDARG